MKIDKNVPMPKTRSKYPFDIMDVGDSFFSENSNALLSGAIGAFRKKCPETKFTVRQVEENGVKGVRCWRIE